jgi:D-amino peptidase
MKIYISADIEGITGIAHWDEATRDHPAYAEFQQRMTAETAAACEAALASGAQAIVVKDAHGTGRNILAEQLPAPTQLIRGWSGHPYGMVQALDSSFDALLLVGYHSPAASGGHPLAHTFRSSIHRIELNSERLSEFRVNSLTARAEGVPTVFLSGDASLCDEAVQAEPGIVTVTTHTGVGASTFGRHPADSIEQIKEGVGRALTDLPDAALQPMPKPYTLEIRYRIPLDAYAASFYPGAVLMSDDTVRVETGEWFEVLRALQFLK